MGFLNRIFGRPSNGVSISAHALPGDSLVSVVGESHRQPALEHTAKLATRGVPPLPILLELDDQDDLPWFHALLIREPGNRHDKNAVMVYSSAGHIGYLSRDDAKRYQYLLKLIEQRGMRAGACSAFMRRADNGMWGVVLVLSDPGECVDDLMAEE